MYMWGGLTKGTQSSFRDNHYKVEIAKKLLFLNILFILTFIVRVFSSYIFATKGIYNDVFLSSMITMGTYIAYTVEIASFSTIRYFIVLLLSSMILISLLFQWNFTCLQSCYFVVNEIECDINTLIENDRTC